MTRKKSIRQFMEFFGCEEEKIKAAEKEEERERLARREEKKKQPKLF